MDSAKNPIPRRTETTEEKLPPRPGWRLDEIGKLKAKLENLFLYEFLNVRLEKDDYDRFLKIVFESLPGRPQLDVLERSVASLLGATPTESQLKELAWRLAGNTTRLNRGYAVTPWAVQACMEWVPLQIVSCRRELSRRGVSGAVFSFRVLAGTPAGKTIDRWLSRNQCYIIAKSMGFTRARGDDDGMPYHVFEDLMRFRCLGLLRPELCRDGPMFREIEVPAQMLRWNRDVIRKRMRIDPKFRCKKGMPATFPCRLCPLGYLSCPAGTHRLDWKLGDCPRCRKRAMTDPERRDGICVDCALRPLKPE